MKTTKNKDIYAEKVFVSGRDINVILNDGNQIIFSAERFKRLKDAKTEDLKKVKLIIGGTGLRWEKLDEDISVEGLCNEEFEFKTAKDVGRKRLLSALNHYKYQPKLTKFLDDVTELNKDLIYLITLWKTNRYYDIDETILHEIKMLRNLNSHSSDEVKGVLKKLIDIDGIDLPLASTILRFSNPDVFQIIDKRAYRALYGRKFPLYHSSPVQKKINIYFEYLDNLKDLSKEKKIDFKYIDRVLYEFDKEEYGKL